MVNKIPLGYQLKSGDIIENEKEIEVVKWLYKNILEYSDNPPEFLIEETMEEKELSYNEAKAKVSFSKVQLYIVAELNARLPKVAIQDEDIDKIKALLEAEPSDELVAEIIKQYRIQEGIILHSNKHMPQHKDGHYTGKVNDDKW